MSKTVFVLMIFSFYISPVYAQNQAENGTGQRIVALTVLKDIDFPKRHHTEPSGLIFKDGEIAPDNTSGVTHCQVINEFMTFLLKDRTLIGKLPTKPYRENEKQQWAAYNFHLVQTGVAEESMRFLSIDLIIFGPKENHKVMQELKKCLGGYFSAQSYSLDIL